jgi:hypothetical protein
MNQSVFCECVGWKQSISNINGVSQHSFVLDLCAIDSGEMLVKYLNCNSTTANRYTVKHNGDFAKLYRLTIGDNPTKRFSEAQYLVSHFLGCRFFAEYKTATGKNKIVYSKVISLKPEKPILNDAWTSTGMVKKARKVGNKIPETYRNNTGFSPETYRNNTGFSPDDKTLQPANSLGLEAVFNPIQSPEPRGSNVKRVLLPQEKVFSYSRFENETINEFHNRIIDAHLFTALTDTAQCFYNNRLDVLLKSFGFEKPEAEIVAMKDVIIKYGQEAYLSKLVSQQNNGEWLTEFNGVDQTTWN